jgi:hypothetical protein
MRPFCPPPSATPLHCICPLAGLSCRHHPSITHRSRPRAIWQSITVLNTTMASPRGIITTSSTPMPCLCVPGCRTDRSERHEGPLGSARRLGSRLSPPRHHNPDASGRIRPHPPLLSPGRRGSHPGPAPRRAGHVAARQGKGPGDPPSRPRSRGARPRPPRRPPLAPPAARPRPAPPPGWARRLSSDKNAEMGQIGVLKVEEGCADLVCLRRRLDWAPVGATRGGDRARRTRAVSTSIIHPPWRRWGSAVHMCGGMEGGPLGTLTSGPPTTCCPGATLYCGCGGMGGMRASVTSSLACEWLGSVPPIILSAAPHTAHQPSSSWDDADESP